MAIEQIVGNPLGRKIDLPEEIDWDDATIEFIAGTGLRLKAAGIQTAHIHDAVVTAAKLSGIKLVGGIEYASGFSATLTSSATYIDTAITDDIVISATSTIVCIVGCSIGTDVNVSADGNRNPYIKMVIDGTDSSEMFGEGYGLHGWDSSTILGIKTGVGAGTITSKLQIKTSNADTGVSLLGTYNWMLTIAFTE